MYEPSGFSHNERSLILTPPICKFRLGIYAVRWTGIISRAMVLTGTTVCPSRSGERWRFSDSKFSIDFFSHFTHKESSCSNVAIRCHWWSHLTEKWTSMRYNILSVVVVKVLERKGIPKRNWWMRRSRTLPDVRSTKSFWIGSLVETSNGTVSMPNKKKKERSIWVGIEIRSSWAVYRLSSLKRRWLTNVYRTKTIWSKVELEMRLLSNAGCNFHIAHRYEEEQHLCSNIGVNFALKAFFKSKDYEDRIRIQQPMS